ncbi:MAG: CoA pyrophosphatase [SAR324 cluster bacterium]|nr:CoA pyrophosphatase [SAR324 cluster bacterium]
MLTQLEQQLARFHPPHNPNIKKRASVLILLLERDDSLNFLLTRRSDQLRSHSGQVSFPGGKQDHEDSGPLETALRETHEELGIVPETVRIIGQIDQIISRHLYLVTPFVGIIQNDLQIIPNPDEIESVFEVPVHFFMESEHHTAEIRNDFQRPFISHHYHYADYDIWGMTAMLILRLLEIGWSYVPDYPVYHPEVPTWMELSQNFSG